MAPEHRVCPTCGEAPKGRRWLSSADAVRCQICGTFYHPTPPASVNVLLLVIATLIGCGGLALVVLILQRPITVLIFGPFVILLLYAAFDMTWSAIRGMRGDPNGQRGFDVRPSRDEPPPPDPHRRNM